MWVLNRKNVKLKRLRLQKVKGKINRLGSLVSVYSAIVPARLEFYLLICLMKIRNAWDPTKPRLINLKYILMAFASNPVMVKDLLFTRLLKMKIVSFLVVMARHKCQLRRFWTLLILVKMILILVQMILILVLMILILVLIIWNLALMPLWIVYLYIRICLKLKRIKIWNWRRIGFKLRSSF